uniref:Uncharacterized protein n=1 Tax=Rhizophora mucronata TaxID=61149 RepID=A0A2P2KD35_RHIMU
MICTSSRYTIPIPDFHMSFFRNGRLPPLQRHFCTMFSGHLEQTFLQSTWVSPFIKNTSTILRRFACTFCLSVTLYDSLSFNFLLK